MTTPASFPLFSFSEFWFIVNFTSASRDQFSVYKSDFFPDFDRAYFRSKLGPLKIYYWNVSRQEIKLFLRKIIREEPKVSSLETKNATRLGALVYICDCEVELHSYIPCLRTWGLSWKLYHTTKSVEIHAQRLWHDNCTVQQECRGSSSTDCARYWSHFWNHQFICCRCMVFSGKQLYGLSKAVMC